MSNLYNLTQQLHQTIKEKAEKHGLELEIKNRHYIFEDVETIFYRDYELSYPDFKILIEAPQIRQILLAFKEVLGENPKIEETKKDINNLPNKLKILSEKEKLITTVSIKIATNVSINFIPKTQAEALYNKWLDGLEPLFYREPETVVTELLEILKSI
jgi:hypothetical protein